MKQSMILIIWQNLWLSGRAKIIRKRPDRFKVWRDDEFLNRFRLNKDTIKFFLRIIEPKIASQTSSVENERSASAEVIGIVIIRLGNYRHPPPDHQGDAAVAMSTTSSVNKIP